MLTCFVVLKPFDRSPANYRSNGGPKSRGLPSHNRFGQATSNLSNIREESVESEGDNKLRNDVYCEFHTNMLSRW